MDVDLGVGHAFHPVVAVGGASDWDDLSLANESAHSVVASKLAAFLQALG